MTILIAGKTAERLSALTKDEAKEIVMDDIRRMYGKEVEEELLDFMIKDWTKEEYIEGGYTYPHIKETEDTRKVLREPIMDNKVYFVGEWTSGRFSLITGALESSYVAYDEICKNL